MAAAARPSPTPPPPQRRGSVACQTCPVTQKPPKRAITIRASMFFDGTLNNRTNIAARQRWERRSRAAGGPVGPAPGVDSESYVNDYSNVAKLDQVLDLQQPGYDHAIKIYVEGIGTTDNDGDSQGGYAFGTGGTGVIAKVESGVNTLFDRIAALVADPAEVRIAYIHLDSFGFSRGAAAARNFIHQAVNAGQLRIRNRLQARGIETGPVTVKFVGLFDTVSSIGYGLSPGDIGWENNTDATDFHLRAISVAEKVVQLAAAEEHRTNFPLTNINSAGGGLQIFLPGVHSDVGGGYVDNADEREWKVLNINNPEITRGQRATVRDALARDRQWLIDRGWYLPAEIDAPTDWNEVRVNRSNIRNSYPRIPLQMMATYAKSKQLVFRPALARDHAIPPELGRVQQLINANLGASRAAWIANTTPLMKALRHGYLHFSARLNGIGHGPRWTDGGPLRGRRERKVHDG